MGIKDIIKNMWSIQPPEENNLTQPMSGGNNYTVQQELKARIRNLYQNPSFGNGDLENTVYEEYYLMLFQKNYFVNLFDIETDDQEFRMAWNMFVENCFWYGDGALVNEGIKDVENGSMIVPVYIKERNYNKLGYLDKDFEYYYTAQILPMMGDSKMWKQKPDLNLKAIKNKSEDYVYAKWNMQGYGAWVWMYKFIKFQRELMFLTHGSAYLQKEIMFYKINNMDTVDDEIRTLYNPKINIVPTYGVDWSSGETKLENRWNTESLSTDRSMLINEVYDWFINKYYDLFGRKYNIDSKKERNISMEVEASQEQFDVLINETMKFMEMALKDCETKFGKKGTFKIYANQDNDKNEDGDSFDNEENGDGDSGIQ